MKKLTKNQKLIKIICSVMAAFVFAVSVCFFLSVKPNFIVSASEVSEGEFSSDYLYNVSFDGSFISSRFLFGKSYSGGGTLRYISNDSSGSTSYGLSSSANFYYDLIYSTIGTSPYHFFYCCVFLSFNNLSSFGSLISSVYYSGSISEFDGVNIVLNNITPIGYIDYVFENGHIYYFQYFQGDSDYIVYPVGSLEPSLPSDPSIIDGYVDVWDSVFGWLMTSLSAVLTLFWVNGQLSVFGVLSIVALSVSVFFLFAYFVVRFLTLRGK